MKKLLLAAMMMGATMGATKATAADYIFDIEGMHAAIEFRVKHLGYSWLTGRFDKFDGKFSYDEENPAASSVTVDIDVRSVNTNHAIRDKHISEERFLNVENHPSGRFESTRIEVTGDKTGLIHGNLTLNGVTKEITLDAKHIGGGDDPWGGFRHGFEATTVLKPAEFNYEFNYGDVIVDLYVEGIRQ
ncbi:YceI family protein [Pseudemcibacter aquimaris]|uniref:YceI family protein n=1 Tax=Pseudemcibacter aquimaris TaxID=2857064 RepID=UPI002010FA45|nr:YceI family protein [Pseudemcibacter aquimaris]MCC3859843.1 YceI family protein [Pseudemcibacter aquimaris]WDU57175.1 YceI family protein [Pseudemcibacter aquimaris]